MPRVAVLIAGSPNASFYSQTAAVNAALRALPWRRWQPSVHLYLGDEGENGAERRRWDRYLQGVDVTHVLPAASHGQNWAQVDATLALAPRDADVLLSLDADTLPVAGFEDVLDRVAAEDLIAGVMAHYPPPPGTTPQADWVMAADGLIGERPSFDHAYSLVEPSEPDDRRLAPFYVNGGVVFYSRACFDRFAPLYLELRARLEPRLFDEAFSGQMASTLAVIELGLRTWALPMRYNFPNDPIAERLYPDEAAQVVIHHYLRTSRFDRHAIFATGEGFDRFGALTLEGPDLRFQSAVRNLFGSRYPFP